MKSRSEFIEVLIVTANALHVSMAGLNRRAGVGRNLLQRASSGRAVPRKSSAQVLLAAIVGVINEQIRKKAAEIAVLQRYGETLKEVYAQEYEARKEVS